MKAVLSATAAIGILAAASPASAADLPPRTETSVKAPADVAPSLYRWTGFYIGVNGGGALGRSRFDFARTSNSFDISGGLLGGSVGYNFQAGPAVFGLEGDFDWSTISGNGPCVGGALSCQSRNDWLATARGRIGYAFAQFLPYVTGGAAFGGVDAGVPGFGLVEKARTGWTVGAGIEYGFLPGWSAKLEYLYVDLGRIDCGTACAGIVPTSDKLTTSVIRAGINFRF